MKEKTEKKRQRTYLKTKTFLTWDRIQTSRSRKHSASNKMNPKSSTPRHIVIKMTKIEDKQKSWDFPSGPVKNLPAKAEDTGFDPWSWKTPHATEQLSPCATTTEPVSCNY